MDFKGKGFADMILTMREIYSAHGQKKYIFVVRFLTIKAKQVLYG